MPAHAWRLYWLSTHDNLNHIRLTKKMDPTMTIFIQHTKQVVRIKTQARHIMTDHIGLQQATKA